jgi:heat shock protein HslJ
MRRFVPLSLALFSLVLLSACVKTTYLHEQPDQIAGTPYGTWELVEMDAERGLSALPATHPVTLTLGPGVANNVSGQAFLNSYSGSVRLNDDGHVVEVPRIAMTRRAGPIGLMELESEYFRLWQLADHLVADGPQLIVQDQQARPILRFRRPLAAR